MGLLSFFDCKKTNADTLKSNQSKNNCDAKVNEIQINRFFYRYNNSIGGNDYSFEIKKDQNGKYIFTYESREYYDYGEMITEVDETIITGLEQLYVQNKIQKWDGFHGVNKYVLDGWGFTLSIEVEGGKNVNASGSNKIPDGFRIFESDMKKLFDPIIEKIKNQKKMEKISEGVSGQCDYVMAFFKQKGKAGFDEYSMIINPKTNREKNFDVKINSISGQIFPEGQKEYYCQVDEDKLNLDKLTALIEKYHIINWYNFEGTDPDYSNKEWFQVQFGFNQKYINAHGTIYPENYYEFRQELLLWLKEIIDNLEK